MSDKKESTLPKGISFKKPHENAPDWILGQICFKVDEAIEYLQKMQNSRGWVNIDQKRAKSGHIYLDLNTYDLEQQFKNNANQGKGQNPNEPFNEDDIPF